MVEADAVPAGSDGLFFLPYPTGERMSHPNPRARAGFIGLTSRHTRANMTRALLEGMGFWLRDSSRLMRRAVELPDALEVRISDGGAQGPIWQQIIADVLNATLVNVNTSDQTTLRERFSAHRYLQ